MPDSIATLEAPRTVRILTDVPASLVAGPSASPGRRRVLICSTVAGLLLAGASWARGRHAAESTGRYPVVVFDAVV